ncbi:hypothetical protein [Actinomyces ruminis]|uniref:Uncharacterized protein n=1 Tax=Actinomyces ruminis TaxID=1937003 RepID=A0ABX4MBD9_9ACTO|nr:hypothetical protein [Actinomyces ruminis]PHP52775.1 hypothetical protein BW737_008005 [Actinomyces ruminis]
MGVGEAVDGVAVGADPAQPASVGTVKPTATAVVRAVARIVRAGRYRPARVPSSLADEVRMLPAWQ